MDSFWLELSGLDGNKGFTSSRVSDHFHQVTRCTGLSRFTRHVVRLRAVAHWARSLCTARSSVKYRPPHSIHSRGYAPARPTSPWSLFIRPTVMLRARRQTNVTAPFSFTLNDHTHRVLGVMLPDGLALQVPVLQMIFRHDHCSNMASAKRTAACQNSHTQKKISHRKETVWWPTRHLTAYEVS